MCPPLAVMHCQHRFSIFSIRLLDTKTGSKYYSWSNTCSSCLSSELVAKMLCRIKVWSSGWPVHSLQTLMINIFLDKLSSMRSSIFIHSNEFRINSTSIWSDIWFKFLVSISNSNENSSVERVEISVTTHRDDSPNQYSTSITVSFNNVRLMVSWCLVLSVSEHNLNYSSG
ncbi:hypothetical protein AVEN_172756-1 [Araneus ventricosus]|uniref:Uncharacterized protein n=1 Tax=Araneus ventricosus TaxID=182803 RepID=A0A4Y2BHV1_ARAVE|nr:hypothetical protein AVEN_172756-1 [Araneus ventricosus]